MKRKFATASNPQRPVPRLVFIGGFLGAGKTTTVTWLARTLMNRGERLAIITNDQSHGLIDTQIASLQAPTSQVAGGCFCCRSEELVGVIEKQTQEVRPTIILAEPVGSCTDLQATLVNPLRQVFRTPVTIAPLVTIVDARRAAQHFLKKRAGFQKDVSYIWLKQLEDAELIALNKVDLLPESDLARISAALHRLFPQKQLVHTMAATGFGMPDLLKMMWASDALGVAPEVDYAIYARGEALLGWVNMEASASATRAFSPDAVLTGFASRIQSTLEQEEVEVAHLKLSFSSDGNDLSVVNVTFNGEQAKASVTTGGQARAGKILVNLRAVGDPSLLCNAVRSAASSIDATIKVAWVRNDAFRPAPPKPGHRISVNGRAK